MISDIIYINQQSQRLRLIENDFNGMFGREESESYNHAINEFYRRTISVEWEYNNNKVTISCEKDKGIRAYTTPDSSYMIITYKKGSTLFPPPNNCVIYNGDGSILRIIKFPKLISKEAQMYGERILFNCFIDGFKWVKNSTGGYDVAIILCFGDGWYETRLYDYINDIFRECIEEGRA